MLGVSQQLAQDMRDTTSVPGKSRSLCYACTQRGHPGMQLNMKINPHHILLLKDVQVLPIDACWLQDAAANEILAAVRDGTAEAQLQL